MQRLLVGSAASSLRRCPRRLLAGPTLPAPVAATAPYLVDTKLPLPAASRIQIQSGAFSTSYDGAPQPPAAKTPKKKLGIIAKIRHVIRTAFGNKDHTPRGIQERKDMLWIVLAVSHRKLRIENQRKLLQNSNKEIATTKPSPLNWREETKEQLKGMIDEVVSHLDEKTDINELSLLRLRTEVQSFLKPQITHLLHSAHDVEEKMIRSHGVNDEAEEDYVFSENESQEYKKILLQEYEHICQLLTETNSDDGRRQQRTPDPVPYYEMKKGAIETVLTFFDWLPDAAKAPTKSTNADEEDYVDEFGFSPNLADSEILPAMRYYHVRNLVRSALVRRSPVNADDSNGDDQHSHCYHSLLPFKSTVPSAGRGVYVDGYAPAGTLLALFPGKVWPKEHLQSASIQTQMQFSQNDSRDQLSMRYDDILIDSRLSPYTVVKNLWALGHIVNHPPAPTVKATPLQHEVNKLQPSEESDKSDNATNHHPHEGPNCGIVPINFTDQTLEGHGSNKLREYIPNEYELTPKAWAKNAFDRDEIVMHGLGLVALRDVKDEELFYDYRMSPDAEAKEGGSEYPSWYYVWDQEAINSRWDMDE